jgi:hypothetical protein
VNYQHRTNQYRDALERWHRCRIALPALDHGDTFPKPEDYGVEGREAERVQLEVQHQFTRIE